MNTSAKGAAYERAFKKLLLERGAVFVVRAAASKGPFDLVAVYPDLVLAYQMKAGRMSCDAARRALKKLPTAWNWMACFVHRTKEREFCEH